ncbi:MAG: hypothetical protein KKH01_09705 [Firmicutes bacterium]|nr:hypothetical protein [Bacillota bacterium]
MPSFLMIQWGIVAFFVIIHFLLGFLRGSSKSTYFTIVSIIMTVVTILIVSRISFNWLFSMISIDSLVALVQNYVPLPDVSQYLVYLEDPTITGFIVAILDFVLRIVAFIIFYPFIKFSLTLTIFKPIWKHGVKKALLKKQNEKAQEAFEEKNTENKKFVPSKKLHKGVLGRLFGGAMGAVRGFIVAFVFLIPVLVLANFVSGVSGSLPISDDSVQTLSTGDQQLIAIPSEIQSILDNIADMNQNGLGAITRSITVGDQSLDRYIFDAVFTTQVKDATNQVTNLNFGNELEGVFGIASILLEGGYLDDNFDYTTISSDDLDDIEQIFTYISESDLLNYLIPFAIETGLPVALDYLESEYENPYDRPGTAAALDAFTSINWSDEFMNVYGIVEAILEFGSVAELQAYAADPNLILEMTPEQATAFANIIRAFGDMNSLVLVNAAFDYAVTLPQFTSQITWVAPEDVDAYVADRFGFIIDNPDFFIGVDGEIAKLADLIEIIFNGDVDLVALMDSASDPAALLELQDPEWAGLIIDQLVQMDLIVQSIPVGIDAAMPSVVGTQVDQQMADDIAAALDGIEWDAEIQNVGDIYTEVLKLGLSSLLGGDVDKFGMVDIIALEHMDSIRAIVSSIFEGSELVNAAIEIASPAIVDHFVTDPELRDLVNLALMSDPSSGVVDFSFGDEVNSLLTIFESIYGFTTASELGGFSSLDQDAKIELFSQFGSLSDTEYAAFEDAFAGLQLLDRMGTSALDYAKTKLGIEELYVPTEVDLGHDVTAILGLVYYAAQYTYDNRLSYDSYEEIDFAPLLADETFRSYLLSTDLENHSSLLFTNIAYNIKRLSEDEALSSYVAIPTTLVDLDPEDPLWETEVNAFLGAILDLGASFEGSDVLTLSVRDVLTLKNDTSTANLELFTQFADPTKATATFGSLDSSQILRTSLVNIMNTLGESTVNSLGFAVTTPEIALDGEMLAPGMIVELINGLAVVAADAFDTMGVTTLAEFKALGGTDDYLNAFSQLEDESLDALGDITIIRGMISDVLLSPDMQSFLVDKINTTQEILSVEDDFFAVDPILLDSEGALKAEEISGLLIAMRSLGITSNAALSSLGVNTFTSLIGKNEDLVTGEDDFDRVLGSGYLYITLDKILQLDAIGTFVSDTLGTSLGTDMSTFDLTLPDAMLGNAIDHDPIELNRIPKDEFRRMVNSFAVLGDLGGIGLDTFSNLVDPSLSEDDFTTFIASDFIYVVLARLFDNEGFGTYVSDMLGGAFGDDPITLNMGVPLDAQGTSGVENELITRVQLRNIMVSFDMLGIGGDTDVSVATIMNMIGVYTYDETDTKDDFMFFLDSIYLQDKISQLMLSDTIINIISMDRFVPADFTLPTSATVNVDGYDRLTQQELYDTFNGINVLGINDFSNVTIGIDSLTALTTDQLDTMLLSSYTYRLIDLFIASESDQLTIPLDAYDVLPSDYAGWITKTEIRNVFSAFSTLGSDPSAIDISSLTVADILTIIDAESVIVNQMISDEVETALATTIVIDNLTLPEAYETIPGVDRLLINELRALVESMTVIGMTNLTGSFAVDNVGVAEMQNLHYLGLGTDPVSDEYDSYVIHVLITDQIETALTVDELILPEAYNSTSGQTRMNADEIQALILSMSVMSITDLSSSVSVSNVGVAEMQNLHYLGLGTDPVSDDYDSYIIHTLITDQIETALTIDELILPEAYNSTSGQARMNADEIQSLILSMTEMNITDLSAPVSADDLTQTQLQNIHYYGLGTDPVSDDYDSYIIHHMISEGIKTAVTNIPSTVYMSNGDIIEFEIQGIIDAIAVLNPDPLATLSSMSFASNGLTPAVIQGLLDINSRIVYRQISEGVISASLDVTEAYALVGDYNYDVSYVIGDISIPEMNALVAAMTEMGISDLSGSFDPNTITVAQLQNLHYIGLGTDPVTDTYESYIIHHLISDGIIGVLTNIPSTVYMGNGDLLAIEVQGVISAVAVLNADPSATLGSMSFDNAGLTPAKISDLLDLNSKIIYRQISEGIISVSLDVPEAYALVGDYNYDASYVIGDISIPEMNALVAAMTEMGIGDLSGTFDPNTITVAQLQNLHYIGLGTDPVTDTYDSYMVHHMISDGVTGVLTNIPSTVYMGNGDLVADEVQGVISAVAVLNTDPSATLGSMSFANAGLTPAKISDLLDLNSKIVYRQISEGIISVSLDVAEAYALVGEYNYDASYVIGDISIPEMNALVEAMNIMGISDLTGSFDPNTITVSNLQDLHYVGLGTDPVTDTYDSYMVHHMISNGVVSALANRPSTVYMGNGDITAAEVQHVISAIGILNTNPSATLGSMSFANAGLTPSKIESLLDLNSLIVDRQISEGIITASLDVDEAYALVGEFNYDALYGTGDLSIPEMYALVEAMNIMGISDLTGSFNPSGITVSNLQSLHYVGLGTDPGTDTYDSYIVHHMISDGIASTLTNRPSTVYMGNGDITAAEVQHVISAIGILNTDPSATLASMSFANNGLTPAKITALLDLDSLIIDRQISEGIISANLDVVQAYALVGEFNYDALYVTGDLNIDEMYAVVAAMTVMGLADLSATFSADDLTTTQLQDLHYIGLGTDPVTELYDSYIIHNIISDSLVLINPQTIAYDLNGYIKEIEVQGFIDDLNTLGISTISDFAAISDSAGILAAFSDDIAVAAVFANSAANNLTLTYYFIDSIMDPGDSTIPGVTRTTDAYGFTAVIRNDLSAFIIFNN